MRAQRRLTAVPRAWRGVGGGERPDAADSLWRGAQAFRLLTVLYAAGWLVGSSQNYESPRLAWALFALQVAVTGVFTAAYGTGGGRTRAWVGGEFAAVALLVAATRLVASPEYLAVSQPLPTTLWAANAVISAALLAGPAWGVAGGLAVGLAHNLTRGFGAWHYLTDSTIPVLMAIGFAVGITMRSAQRSQERLTTALAAEADVAARERIAREVHDGVLQVLALVSRRGERIGGEAAELAQLAAEQEVALRTLIGRAPQVERPYRLRDAASAFRALATPRVQVSVPPGEFLVPRELCLEVEAAAAAALSNTRHHAGPDAQSWIMVEDLFDEMVVTVRDDGRGTTTARLAEAADEGRWGVASSIRRRLEGLSGSARVVTAPGEGVEWELRVPLPGRRAGRPDRG